MEVEPQVAIHIPLKSHSFLVGSDNDFRALKQHKFFTGVDFSNLLNTKPPLLEVISPYKKKATHNSTVTNINDPSPNSSQFLLNGFNQRESRMSMKSEFLSNIENEKQNGCRECQDKLSRGSKPQSQPQREHEKIILSGNIAKRHPYLIFFQTRFLVLSDVNGQLRLRYYNPSNGEMRV